MAQLTPSSASPPFDIVSTYRRLLAEDPDLTMPVAAIEALVEALATSSASTVSETLALLSASVAALKRAIPNPISLSAGTDLFQRYLITTLNRQPGGATGTIGSGGGGGGDFDAIRTHLLSNGRLFVERAKASREKIAGFGRHFVRDGATVLTNGGSRVVGALLRSAAEASGGSIRFRVIYVLSPPSPSLSSLGDRSGSSSKAEGAATVAALRKKGVPVATIREAAVGYALGQVDMVIVGAEGVVENGGIISRLGTYQIGMLAKAAGKPFYVVAESHKFVRLYPLSQYDLPIDQRVIEFTVKDEGDDGTEEGMRGKMDVIREEEDEGVDVGVDVGGEDERRWNEKTPVVKDRNEYFADGEGEARKSIGPEDAVDYTPPNLISGIITESGVLTPSAVSEELIKIW